MTDAISRDAIIGKVKELFSMGECYCDEHSIIGMINKLPSVTQKSGKWLITPMSNIVYCSECDYIFKDIPASIVKHFKHCPNCGKKMVESQEIEKISDHNMKMWEEIFKTESEE